MRSLTPGPGGELVDVVGVRPPLPVPALDDDLVLGGRPEAVEDEVAGVGEGVGEGGGGARVGDGGDDVGPFGLQLLLLLLLLLLAVLALAHAAAAAAVGPGLLVGGGRVAAAAVGGLEVRRNGDNLYT